jgi:hypothetical protein
LLLMSASCVGGDEAFAGDCIPFYHDGTFHLFYLFDRRHHGSKWGGNILDTCIDQRRTMITRRHPEPDGDRLFFFARDGEVAFEDITIRPLSQP